MKFDVIGRINNMRLPDGKTAVLYSVYEAVSNSIHAINDRFGEDEAAKKGRVDVDIAVDDAFEIDTITITDNGIGFTDANLDSFETSDSRFKYQRGGKGVGRFIWIKMFETIKVDSVVAKAEGRKRVRFTFVPEEEDSIADKRVTSAPGEEIRTSITLSDMRSDQRGRIKPSSYLKDLALHFFPQFISGTLPEVTITYRGEASSLNEFIAEQIDVPEERSLLVDFGDGPIEVKVNHLFVDASISTGLRNSYLLTAHGRLVGDPVSIERKYALKELPDGKAYVAVISSVFLDERVDQERLGFKLTAEQGEILQSAILEAAEEFLHAHIARMRSRQKTTVEGLIAEHPQLQTQFEDIDEYVAQLGPGMDDEQIAQNLFVLLYRDERDLKKRIESLDQLASLEAESRKSAEEVLSEISNQAKHRLAELVVKRHQLLQLANILLKVKDDGQRSYHYERVIHELICPMREMYKSGDYEDHNLWMLDDTLAAYQLFASDKPISSLTEGSSSTKEPDLIFFNPLGFRREGTNDPIVIVEFKRPGDVLPTKDPVNQVLDYIEELQGSRVRDVDGEVVADIDTKTPFECIIVCELTGQARGLFEKSLAQNSTPDGEGYYGWSSRHLAHIRVISFKKMLRDAEIRNQAFFNQLTLGSPSLAAKKRQAKAREKRAARKGPAPAAA
ncbi:ATP-binding protein [Sphingomonas sp. LB-2]|uniref:ATP-binding protein n=1 Tax=Sphingomonas caeni TaxID=2984949 RepID=UPI002230C9D3|nr:ATP-binding protein [Sphingomonas caeni]MCW3846341.1 ATP-binding protein [Sphingomonas caeni]